MASSVPKNRQSPQDLSAMRQTPARLRFRLKSAAALSADIPAMHHELRLHRDTACAQNDDCPMRHTNSCRRSHFRVKAVRPELIAEATKN